MINLNSIDADARHKQKKIDVIPLEYRKVIRHILEVHAFISVDIELLDDSGNGFCAVRCYGLRRTFIRSKRYYITVVFYGSPDIYEVVLRKAK